MRFLGSVCRLLVCLGLAFAATSELAFAAPTRDSLHCPAPGADFRNVAVIGMTCTGAQRFWASSNSKGWICTGFRQLPRKEAEQWHVPVANAQTCRKGGESISWVLLGAA